MMAEMRASELASESHTLLAALLHFNSLALSPEFGPTRLVGWRRDKTQSRAEISLLGKETGTTFHSRLVPCPTYASQLKALSFVSCASVLVQRVPIRPKLSHPFSLVLSLAPNEC